MNHNDDRELTADRRRLTAIGWRAVRGVAAAVLLAAATVEVHAQSLKGTVFHRDSNTRAPGVIVVVDDEGGSTVARALSGDNGGFDVRVPTPGRYVVRLLRIGFRPTVLAPISVPAEGVDAVRAILGGEAVMLSAVTVRTDNVCGSTQDAGQVIAQLWEEARKALTATELSAGSRTLDVDWQAFQFLMDRSAVRAREQSVLPRSGATERPFVSVSADSLLRHGYVVQDGRDLIYRAPDAAALLSNEFAATHCFRVDPPSYGREQWVGVAFRPTPARDRMREISGTVWLDRASAELRLLEFRYTNLPPEANDPEIGGFVEYVRLPTGHWLVARWAIRTPHMVRRTVGGAAIPGGGRDDRIVLSAIGVTGGELLRARRGADLVYRADSSLVAAEGSVEVNAARPSRCGAALRPGATVRGTVANGSVRVEGAVVTVSWTGPGNAAPTTLSSVSDRRGGFAIPCVAKRVSLTVAASSGTERVQPVTLGPVTGNDIAVDIEFGPLPAKRP